MYSITKIVKPALLGLSLVALAACEHTSTGTAGLNQNVIRNSVQMVRLPLEIKSEADATDSLSSQTAASIQGFLKSVNAGYGDIIMLDGPSASPERLAAVENLIARTGLTYGGTNALGAKPKDGTIMLYVERYTVQSPNCNYWPDEASGQTKNNDSSFHGCTSRINLGLMVANPRELVSGHYSGTSTKTAVDAINAPQSTSQSGSGNTQGAVQGLNNAASGGTGNGSN